MYVEEAWGSFETRSDYLGQLTLAGGALARAWVEAAEIPLFRSNPDWRTRTPATG